MFRLTSGEEIITELASDSFSLEEIVLLAEEPHGADSESAYDMAATQANEILTNWAREAETQFGVTLWVLAVAIEWGDIAEWVVSTDEENCGQTRLDPIDYVRHLLRVVSSGVPPIALTGSTLDHALGNTLLLLQGYVTSRELGGDLIPGSMQERGIARNELFRLVAYFPAIVDDPIVAMRTFESRGVLKLLRYARS